MQKKPKIRKFKKTDLIQINKIETKVFNKEAYNPYVFLEYSNPKTAFYVAEIKKRVVGYVIITKTILKKAKVISIAVHPKYQSKGIGTKLMKTATKEIKHKGAKKISLEVKKTNKKAIRFYKKLDYQKKKIKKKYYQDGEDAIYMTKKLEPKKTQKPKNP